MMMVYRCLHVLLKNGSRSGSFLVAIAAAALLGACGDAAKEEPIAEVDRAVPDSIEAVDGEVDEEHVVTGVDTDVDDPIDLQNSAEALTEEGMQASVTDPRPVPVEETPASEVEEIVDAPEEPGEPLPEAQVGQSGEVVENAEVEPDAVDVYYDDLAPYGEWLETDVYGGVWQPAGIGNESSDWRPYSDGAWVDSDEGWEWRSNEPFGEICYHYGRWALLADCGWVWVPGFDWAPAWVAWRAADGIAGWAPLPPEYGISYVDTGSSNGWNDADRDYAPGPHCYNFVHLQDLTTGNCRSALLPESRSVSLFASTRSYTGLHRNEHQRICNSRLRDEFPAAQKLNLERHHPKPSSKKETVRSHADNPRSERGGAAPRKLTAVRVDRGWERKQQTASIAPEPKRSSIGQRQRAASAPKEVAVNTPVPAVQENPRGARQPNVESGSQTRQDPATASRQQQQGGGGSGSSVRGTERQRQARAQNQEENARRRRAVNVEEQQQRQRDVENVQRQRADADEEESRQSQLQAKRELERDEQQRRRNEGNARRQRAAEEESQQRARQQQEAENARRADERQRQEENAQRERQQRQQEQQEREESDRRRSEDSRKQSESRSSSDSNPRSKR